MQQIRWNDGEFGHFRRLSDLICHLLAKKPRNSFGWSHKSSDIRGKNQTDR